MHLRVLLARPPREREQSNRALLSILLLLYFTSNAELIPAVELDLSFQNPIFSSVVVIGSATVGNEYFLVAAASSDRVLLSVLSPSNPSAFLSQQTVYL